MFPLLYCSIYTASCPYGSTEDTKNSCWPLSSIFFLEQYIDRGADHIYSTMCIFIVSRSMICCIGEISRPFFNQCSPLLSWHHFPLKTFSCCKYERLTILICDLQARLLKGNFIVNPKCVYKTHEELWDGEL
jgi:hypothetical protein